MELDLSIKQLVLLTQMIEEQYFERTDEEPVEEIRRGRVYTILKAKLEELGVKY